MCMTDPIADMLTRIRNASARKLKKVHIPFSNVKHNLAKLMQAEGFIEDVAVDESSIKKDLIVVLKYHSAARQPVCATLKRVSRPGLRIYKTWDQLPRNGFGISVISTSKGLMSDHDARAQRLGGEVLCQLSTVITEG